MILFITNGSDFGWRKDNACFPDLLPEQNSICVLGVCYTLYARIKYINIPSQAISHAIACLKTKNLLLSDVHAFSVSDYTYSKGVRFYYYRLQYTEIII